MKSSILASLGLMAAGWAGMELSAQDRYVQRGQNPNCAPLPGYCRMESSHTRPEIATQPEGAYVRAPESGEFAGESTSLGIRGFGIRLPAISIELPEVRLPSVVRYRRNAEMYVDSSRAPWVSGRPAEFRQVDRDAGPETGPAKEVTPENHPATYPPPTPPCTWNEQRLLQEMAIKESQLQEMKIKLLRLEALVHQMADGPVPSSDHELQEVSGRQIRQTGWETEPQRPPYSPQSGWRGGQPSTALNQVDR